MVRADENFLPEQYVGRYRLSQQTGCGGKERNWRKEPEREGRETRKFRARLQKTKKDVCAYYNILARPTS